MKDIQRPMFFKSVFTFILCMILMCVSYIVSYAGESPPDFKADKPYYQINLNLGEFSMWNNAMMLGLKQTGGTVDDLHLTMTSGKYGIHWIITSENIDVFKFARYWIGEEAISRLKETSNTEYDITTQQTMKAIGSLSEKLDNILTTPQWPDRQFKGTVVTEDEKTILQTVHGNLILTGLQIQKITRHTNSKIIASGMIKTDGEMEVMRFMPCRPDTLEIIVMSYCPGSIQVEKDIITWLQNQPPEDQPRVEIRYLFYRNEDETNNSINFHCLHGQKELDENITQITIRDTQPDVYHNYLLARANDPESDWKNLAIKAGLNETAVKSINEKISRQRDEIIQDEYKYVHDVLGINDGSPLFIWEGELITEPDDIPFFKDMTDNSELFTICHDQ